ncbi:MAG: hypothetical protein JG782_1826 [Anaerophaga sp.]|nr:hypothetical protein [Anaerophaga sp.]
MTDEAHKEQFLKIMEENIRIVQKIAGVYTRNVHDREDLFFFKPFIIGQLSIICSLEKWISLNR